MFKGPSLFDITWKGGIYTLMLLVTYLTNTKRCKKPEKWLKPWHMGTHLKVLRESSPISTNMTGFRWFSLHPCALDESDLSIWSNKDEEPIPQQETRLHFTTIQELHRSLLLRRWRGLFFVAQRHVITGRGERCNRYRWERWVEETVLWTDKEDEWRLMSVVAGAVNTERRGGHHRGRPSQGDLLYTANSYSFCYLKGLATL